jgi:hypothetical protein
VPLLSKPFKALGQAQEHLKLMGKNSRMLSYSLSRSGKRFWLTSWTSSQ